MPRWRRAVGRLEAFAFADVKATEVLSAEAVGRPVGRVRSRLRLRWGRTRAMSDSSVYPEGDVDQDSEPTMTAPAEGRPDATVPQNADEGEGPHAEDADDQTGSEVPET